MRLTAVSAIVLVALSAMALLPSTAAADGPTTLGRTDWQAARPYSPVSTPNFGQHGHISYYNYIPGPVPAADAGSWTDCGPGNFLCPNATTIGMSLLSRLGGFSCLAAADFTFFQSFVSIPIGTTITQFSVNMSGADDGARVAIYNSAHPTGFIFPGSYIYLGGSQSTTDMSAAMVPGEVNRVVVTQMDDCYSGNNLGSAQIFLNGTVVPPAPTDTTPPTIDVDVSGTLGDNDWYVSDIDVDWTVTDAESDVTTSGCDDLTITTDTAGVTLTCEATSAGGSASESVTLKRDATAPEATATRSPGANGNGWNNSDVTVSFSGTDNLSGVASCDADVVLGEGAGQSASGVCTDNAGNVSDAASVSDINVDKTAPVVTVTGITDGASFIVGEDVPAVGCSTTDALSGVATEAVVSTSGGPLGVVTVDCTGAEDLAGNTASASASYSVSYDFCGFQQPLLAPVQTFKTGSTVPVKFCLADADGNFVATAVAEVYANGVLQGTADVKGNHYHLNLRTKGMSKGPLTIEVRLDDGTSHSIDVALK